MLLYQTFAYTIHEKYKKYKKSQVRTITLKNRLHVVM